MTEFRRSLLQVVDGTRKGRALTGDYTIGYRSKATGEPTQPGPRQLLAHQSIAEDIFFGGAAGGGKSWWLLLTAILTCLYFPKVQVAIFRRHRTQLEDSLIPEFFALVPRELFHWNGNLGKATFKPTGSILWFKYCDRDQDALLYQSAQWVKLLLDEASHFTQFIMDYLQTRVRWPDRSILKQRLLGSNPGGPGHGVLKRRYVRPSGWEVGEREAPRPFEIWRPRPPKDYPNRYMMTRQFIPSFFHDNLAFMAEDPGYLERSILPLGGAKAAQLAFGDWDVNDGMMFGPDFLAERIVTAADDKLLALGFVPNQILPWHVIPRPDWRPTPAAKIFGSVDYGYGNPWAFHLHAILPGGHTRTFFEIYKSGVRDRDQARWMRSVLERLMAKPSDGGCGMQKPEWIVYDPQMDDSRAEVGLNESISEVYQTELGIPLQVVLQAGGGGKGARLGRIQRVKDALAPAADGFPHWTITTACPELIRTLPELPVDEDDPEFIDDDAEDHAYEGCGRFWQLRPAPPRVKLHPELDLLDPISRAEQQATLKRRGELGDKIPYLDVKGLTK